MHLIYCGRLHSRAYHRETDYKYIICIHKYVPSLILEINTKVILFRREGRVKMFMTPDVLTGI